MRDQKPESDQLAAELNDYHKLEIQEIFTSIRTANTLRTQIYSFFGTANVTILGLALSGKHSGLVLLAASIIGTLILVDEQLRRYYHFVLARGVQLEALYAPDKENAFFHRYTTQSHFSRNERIRRYWFALFILFVEIAMAFISKYVLQWSWF